MRKSCFEEKRSFERASKQGVVDVSHLTYPLVECRRVRVELMDIGGGGLCVRMPQAVEVGTLLSLAVTLKGFSSHRRPSSRYEDSLREIPFAAIVEVVRCKKVEDGGAWELGMRFVDIQEEDHQALLRYLLAGRERLRKAKQERREMLRFEI